MKIRGRFASREYMMMYRGAGASPTMYLSSPILLRHPSGIRTSYVVESVAWGNRHIYFRSRREKNIPAYHVMAVGDE
jgi:hypothetical protein